MQIVPLATTPPTPLPAAVPAQPAAAADPLDLLQDAPSPNFTPELRFTPRHLSEVLKDMAAPDTLFITDTYNYPSMRGLGAVEKVTSGKVEQVLSIIGRPGFNQYKRVVGVGGCLALDIARAVATEKDLVLAPTILSTNCITKNRSVIGEGLHVRSLRTAAPREVIVSVDDLLNQDPKMLNHWSQSGWGDFFAKLSAMIDHNWEKRTTATPQALRAEDADVMDALDTLDKKFHGYDREALEYEAEQLHNAGVKVVQVGTNDCSVGGEHKFYKAMMDLYPHLRDVPAHGQVVAIGTLIAVKTYADATGQDGLYKEVRSVFEKIGLPVTQPGLDALGMTREVLERSLDRIGQSDVKSSWLGDVFKSGDFAVLDEIFGPATDEWRVAC